MVRNHWCTLAVFAAGFLYVGVGAATQAVVGESEFSFFEAVLSAAFLGGILAMAGYFAFAWLGRQFPDLDMQTTEQPSDTFWIAVIVLLCASASAGAIMFGRPARDRALAVQENIARAEAEARRAAALTPEQRAAEKEAAERQAKAAAAAREAKRWYYPSRVSGLPAPQEGLPSPSSGVQVGSHSRGAWQLAVIDKRGTGPDTATVDRAVLLGYELTMDSLIAKCPEDETRIADLAVFSSKRLLSEKGVQFSALEFMQAMDKSMSADVKAKLGVKCTEIAAILLTAIKHR